MRRVIAAAIPIVALVAALGCGRHGERRAADVYATPEVPPPSSTSPRATSAIGGGPPVAPSAASNAPDAAVTPSSELDANAVLAEPPPPAAIGKGDAQADGPSGGTYGASSDNRSPGAAYEDENGAGVQAPNTAAGQPAGQ